MESWSTRNGLRGGYGRRGHRSWQWHQTWYGHLSGFEVIPGQEIRRGDILGYSGASGRSTSPHLHFEGAPQGETR